MSSTIALIVGMKETTPVMLYGYSSSDASSIIDSNFIGPSASKFANEQNVPIILATHIGKDFIYQQSDDNIYMHYSNDDEIQTQLFNNI